MIQSLLSFNLSELFFSNARTKGNEKMVQGMQKSLGMDGDGQDGIGKYLNGQLG